MNKPHAPACDRNSEPIFSVIKDLLADCQSVLEIGSGTGQHAVYFAQRLHHLLWHTSDLVENHAGIKMWLDDADLENLRGPHALDVAQPDWPDMDIEAIFSANAVHIMGWPFVTALFAGAGKRLPEGGLFILYGPFNYNNTYTSDSNAQFDIWLKERDPDSAIRNFEDLDQLASNVGMLLKDDIEMPANNRILCWQKK